eukprot:1138630-Karenia_brevis.AAC.1
MCNGLGVEAEESHRFKGRSAGPKWRWVCSLGKATKRCELRFRLADELRLVAEVSQEALRLALRLSRSQDPALMDPACWRRLGMACNKLTAAGR